jgi:hypothetical protein
MIRRALLALPLSAALPAAAAAEPQVALFRIVTARDAVLVGLPAAELAALPGAEPAGAIAARLQRDGHMMLWAYASGRTADGTLALRPTARIAVLRADALRVEPYRPALPVEPPPR